jgi:Tol biopolymer transport system component
MGYYAPAYSSFAAPAFSPDGFKLTFIAYGGPSEADGGNGNAIVVIDTASGTSRVLHPYESFGQRVGPEVVWSPDGRWIAAVTQGEIQATTNGVGLWMIDPNTAEVEEHLIGMGTTPIWSPDGMNLLYIEWGSGSYLEAKVMRVLHDFSTDQVPLPAGSFPFQWVDLSD